MLFWTPVKHRDAKFLIDDQRKYVRTLKGNYTKRDFDRFVEEMLADIASEEAKPKPAITDTELLRALKQERGFRVA